MHEVNVLIDKEFHQLLKSRGALWTALLLPLFFLVIAPAPYLFLVVANSTVDVPLPRDIPVLLDAPATIFRRVLMPLFVLANGLLVPASTATYTVIAEREQRTLDLLVGFPVRIGQVLLAKLFVVGVVTAGLCLMMFSVDAVLLVRFSIAPAGYILALCGLLLAALMYSIAGALLIALLSRDLRTANNLMAVLTLPTLIVCTAVLVITPGELSGLLIETLLLLLAAAIALWIALRIVTFERLLR